MSSGDTGTGTGGGTPAANGRSGAPRLEVTGTQVCASTLASVSGAAAASVFGVAGTIVGTATMSVVATVGGAVYSFWLRRTHARLQEAPIATRVVDLLSSTAGGRVRPQVEGDHTAEPSDLAATAEAASTTETTGADATAAVGASSEASGQDHDGQAFGPWAWVSRRHWGVVAGVAVVFAVSLGLVTLVELIGQRPLADIAGGKSSGGTSIGKIVDDDTDGSDDGTTTTTSPPDTSADPSGSATTEEDSSDSETTSQDTETTSSTSTAAESTTTSSTTAAPSTSTSTTVATPSTTATSTPP